MALNVIIEYPTRRNSESVAYEVNHIKVFAARAQCTCMAHLCRGVPLSAPAWPTCAGVYSLYAAN